MSAVRVGEYCGWCDAALYLLLARVGGCHTAQPAVARYWVPWSPLACHLQPGHQPWTNHIPPVTSPPSPASAAQQIFSTHRRNIFCFTRRAAEHHNTDITLPPRVSRCRGNLCLTTPCSGLVLPAACQLQYLPIRYALIQGPHNTQHHQSYLQQ